MARSKRRKGGRTPKNGPRHPGGRLVQSIGPTVEMLQRRIEQVGSANAKEGDAGWYIGRLFLKGVLTEGQRDAARKWQARAFTYWKMIEMPPQARAVSYDLPAGPPPDDPEAFERAKEQYMQCWSAVSSRGHRVFAATTAAVFDERATDVSLVMEGLEALRKALGLPDE